MQYREWLNSGCTSVDSPVMTGAALAAYFRRIGFQGAADATLDVLCRLHALHPAQIPFEGLDPFLGRPVAIEPAPVFNKLVRQRRGGYCHEQNALFCDVLAACGFTVTPLGARVVWMSPERSAPLTHRLTLVDLPEGRFAADVGFGGQTPTAPLRLESGLVQETAHGTFRITHADGIFATEMQVGDRWEPMYRFTLTPQSIGDFQMANWFVSAHPKTRFTRNLVAARIVDDQRINLINRTLTVRLPDGSASPRVLDSPAALEAALAEIMGIDLPVPVDAIWQRLPTEQVPQWP